MNRISLFMILWLLAFPVSLACADAEHEVALNDSMVVAVNNPVVAVDTAQDMPMGQGVEGSMPMLPEENKVTEDHFYGLKGGYFHPYLSLSGEYTDNLFNVDSDKTSNFLTTVSPGIWFSLPRTQNYPYYHQPDQYVPWWFAVTNCRQ